MNMSREPIYNPFAAELAEAGPRAPWPPPRPAERLRPGFVYASAAVLVLGGANLVLSLVLALILARQPRDEPVGPAVRVILPHMVEDRCRQLRARLREVGETIVFQYDQLHALDNRIQDMQYDLRQLSDVHETRLTDRPG
jgi:hypothetical protein